MWIPGGMTRNLWGSVKFSPAHPIHLDNLSLFYLPPGCAHKPLHRLVVLIMQASQTPLVPLSKSYLRISKVISFKLKTSTSAMLPSI